MLSIEKQNFFSMQVSKDPAFNPKGANDTRIDIKCLVLTMKPN